MSSGRNRRQLAGMVDGTEMSIIEVHEPNAQKCVGTIAMITRDNIAAQTAISLVMTDQSFLQPGEFIKKYIVVGNILTFQRNQCIAYMEGDWVLFIDSDMTWQPNDVKTLVETQRKFDLDIVGGLCFQRGDPYQPTMYKETPTGGYTYMEKWDEDAAVEVDATGMAFALVHIRVFDRILRQKTGQGFPDFYVRSQKKSSPPFFRWEEEVGEDFLFCREAREAGCRVFVDTSVKVGHVGQHVITEETFLRGIAFRPSEATQWRAEILKPMGLEALSAEEAREKLGLVP